MRIALASMGVEEFSLLHEVCEQAGHLPTAYVYSRSMRPRQPAGSYAVKIVASPRAWTCCCRPTPPDSVGRLPDTTLTC